jgi:hypothetical protein
MRTLPSVVSRLRSLLSASQRRLRSQLHRHQSRLSVQPFHQSASSDCRAERHNDRVPSRGQFFSAGLSNTASPSAPNDRPATTAPDGDHDWLQPGCRPRLELGQLSNHTASGVPSPDPSASEFRTGVGGRRSVRLLHRHEQAALPTGGTRAFTALPALTRPGSRTTIVPTPEVVPETHHFVPVPSAPALRPPGNQGPSGGSADQVRLPVGSSLMALLGERSAMTPREAPSLTALPPHIAPSGPGQPAGPFYGTHPPVPTLAVAQLEGPQLPHPVPPAAAHPKPPSAQMHIPLPPTAHTPPLGPTVHALPPLAHEPNPQHKRAGEG